jgi:hypothetical protein
MGVPNRRSYRQLRKASFFPSILEPRRRIDQAPLCANRRGTYERRQNV